jgi:hypothetical protein
MDPNASFKVGREPVGNVANQMVSRLWGNYAFDGATNTS